MSSVYGREDVRVTAENIYIGSSSSFVTRMNETKLAADTQIHAYAIHIQMHRATKIKFMNASSAIIFRKKTILLVRKKAMFSFKHGTVLTTSLSVRV